VKLINETDFDGLSPIQMIRRAALKRPLELMEGSLPIMLVSMSGLDDLLVESLWGDRYDATVVVERVADSWFLKVGVGGKFVDVWSSPDIEENPGHFPMAWAEE
jgi:hypothetical protein